MNRICDFKDTYLTEAFLQLRLLEDDINLADIGEEADDLTQEVPDDIAEPEEETVVDPDASDLEDLSASHDGKVVLKCNCCHSNIYKNPDDVIIVGDTANEDDECPVCGNKFGYTIYGKIGNNEPEVTERSEDDIPTEEEEEAAKPAEPEEDEEVEESLHEAMPLKDRLARKHIDLTKDESIDDNDYDKLLASNPELTKTYPDDDDPEFRDRGKEQTYSDGENESLKEGVDGVETHEEWWGQTDDSPYELEDFGIEVLMLDSKDDETLYRFTGTSDAFDKAKEAGYFYGDDFGESCSVKECGNQPVAEECEDGQCDDNQVDEQHDELKESDWNKLVAANPELEEGMSGDEDVCPECGKNPCECDKDDLHESVEIKADNEASVDVQKNDDGSMTVNVGNAAPEGEVLEPLTPEDETAIEASSDENQEESEQQEEEPIEEPAAEQSTEEEPGDEPEVTEESLDTDREIDDVDDEKFNNLAEGFLRRVYSNVDSFETTGIKDLGESFELSGNIKFKSGSIQPSTFVFESAYISKRGKLVMEGYNETFSGTHKSFTITGKLDNHKYMLESLVYNYTTSQLNESNKSETVRVYGRVK